MEGVKLALHWYELTLYLSPERMHEVVDELERGLEPIGLLLMLWDWMTEDSMVEEQLEPTELIDLVKAHYIVKGKQPEEKPSETEGVEKEPPKEKSVWTGTQLVPAPYKDKPKRGPGRPRKTTGK